MTDIDYEALAKLVWMPGPRDKQTWIDGVRAVVAAYKEHQRARGVVEVRSEDLERALEWRTGNRGYSESNVATKERLEAALAAPGEDGEDTDG